MSVKGLLICLFLIFPFTQSAVAAGQSSMAESLINEVDSLLKKALELRAQSPWRMSDADVQACIDEHSPYREQGQKLMVETRDSSIPSTVKRYLTKAADETVACLACKSDDSACYSAERKIKKARTALHGS